MRILIFAFSLIIVSSGVPAAAQDCRGAVACVLDSGRSYHEREPDGWDGETPLPVLLHFHGWGRQGDLIVNHDRIVSATRRRGVLLVAPNGIGKTWTFWRSGTADVAFANAVLDDVAARYPIDPDRIFVSGYSFGSAMGWRYACDSGDRIAALFAIAVTLDQREVCPQAPQHVRHVHGVKDTVMPFPIGPDGAQTYPVALWRNRLDCQGAGEDLGEWYVVSFLTLTRTEWRDCGGDQTVTLDIHPGGHFIPHGWIARQRDQMLGLPLRYP